jgi:hypothetical protein
MKSKKITFGYHTSVEFIDMPKPASKHIPSWYAKLERYIGGKPEVTPLGTNKGAKLCMPFMESFTTGYIVEAWTDIEIRQEPQGVVIKGLAGPFPAIERNPEQARTLPTPIGCMSNHFVWQFPHSFKTPKGYSCLLTHPLNRHELPFITLSGVIDSDTVVAPGNYPFFLKEGFEGIIPAGTPLAQIIPFKRENWVSEKDNSISKEGFRNTYNATRSLVGEWYKNNAWIKKTYSEGEK